MTINNTVGPWLSELSFVVWAVALFALLFIFIRFKNLDSVIVGSFLTALLALGNTPSMWLEPFYLMLAHTLLATGLLVSHVLFGVLRNGYGDWMITLAGLMGFIDGIFFVTGFPIQYHAWTLFVLFVAMCTLTLYACGKAHRNDGKLGKYIDVGNRHHKASSKAV